jgi:hypothetical protein
MSELVDAAENKEWEELMVRRLLEGVWLPPAYIYSASRRALKSC